MIEMLKQIKNSYQRKKAEIKELEAKLSDANGLLYILKWYMLANARGQLGHAEQCKRAILKRLPEFVHLCDKEHEDLGI